MFAISPSLVYSVHVRIYFELVAKAHVLKKIFYVKVLLSEKSKMPRLYLDKGFKPADLTKGVEFEIDHQESDDSDEEFCDEHFEDHKRQSETFGNIKTVQMNMPFHELQELMSPLTEDGSVRKQMVRPGTGIVVPEKAIVIIHYDAFLEDQKLPFDSTRLRNRPHKFLLNDGHVIPGLDLSIKTMKKEEISRFLVSPDYAYGEMGCPPRIPGNARIMYIVELMNFFESKDAVEFEEMTPEDQKKASFEKIVAVFHCEHQVANDLFRTKYFKPAIARYRKMVRLLEDVSVANEEEDQQRNGYLLKLYLNLCLAYTKIRNSQKAIIYGHLAVQLDENNPKAMYRLGCALLLADEFNKAKQYLLKAKIHKPFETTINKVLLDLERKRKQHQNWETVFCKRIFAGDYTEKKVVSFSESPEIIEFRCILEEQLKKFLSSDEQEYTFSSGYIDWQEDVVKEIATAHKLAFISKIHCGKKIIKVVKK